MLAEWLSDATGSWKLVHECLEKSLSKLLEKRFAANLMDSKYETIEDFDEWLSELVKHSPWRKLIYKLAAQSPRSKFLKKAVQVSSAAGFQHEITDVRIAIQQVEIYSHLLLKSIDTCFRKYNDGPLTEEYEKAFSEVCHVVFYSEQTYLFTQALLHEIIVNDKNEAAIICTHLSQALQVEAHKRDYQDTFDINMALSTGSEIFGEVKQIVLTMLSKKSLNPADIIRLYDLYSSSEPPPTEFIQYPFFIDMLIDSLYCYEGNKIQSIHRSKYIFLLSYASCGGSRSADGESVNEEFEQTKSAMESVLDSIRSERDPTRHFHLLLNAITFPSIASGILYYIHGFLLSDQILSDLQLFHIVLLDEIASNHPALHIRLFEVLCALYDRQSELLQPAEVIIEKQRIILDRFIHLLSVGFSLPVLEKINNLFYEGQIDVSLARYFAIDVLDIIDPPYSTAFVERFLPILLNREIFDKPTILKMPTVQEFIQRVTNDREEGAVQTS
ncbi:unnamed protein product [Thelazia callipaeda]|uniref:THO complex subunit 2 n=1 Tax=Thelazia callipaeda TaxID=103827 RepID=A0A0N5CVM4_THECL|nr:unnamed protein product [Thelazia callipaeda]